MLTTGRDDHSFHENAQRKVIYAVLWVDDYGSMSISKKDIEWYHDNAGSISFAVECDDRFNYSLEKFLKKTSASSPYDYLSYHFHPVRWRGALVPKRIYDLFRIYRVMYHLFKVFSFLGKWAFRWVIVLFFGGLLYLSLHFCQLQSPFFIVPLSILLILVSLASLWLYVQLPKNWKLTVLDIDWCRHLLIKSKEEFVKAVVEFPTVVRHGWNLPPKSTMEFYMSEMGVLADASSVPTRTEKCCRVNGRVLTWIIPTPYYASLENDYDAEWNKSDEEDRGLLEVPINLGNIAFFGFGEVEKEIISNTPAGGIVSCYIHSSDNFSVIKEWAEHLRRNYLVEFVSASEDVEMYMRKNPRPMIIDESLTIKWAFKKDGMFHAIRDVNPQTASLEMIRKQSRHKDIILKINTEEEVPLLCIFSSHVLPVNCKLDVTLLNGKAIIKRIKPGQYRLRIKDQIEP